jgi:hypothetical protein
MTKLITAVFAVAFVIALVLLGYHAVAWVRGAYTNLDANTSALLVVASTALLLCSLIVASAVRSLGQDLVASRKWSAKAGTYERIVELLQTPERPDDAELDRLTRCGLALHAGQNVLRHYRLVRDAAAGSGIDPSSAVVDGLIQAMRRDLGEATLGLPAGDLTTLLQQPVNHRSEPEPDER